MSPEDVMAAVNDPDPGYPECEVEDLVENSRYYASTVVRLMRAGFIKKSRACANKECRRNMFLKYGANGYYWMCQKEGSLCPSVPINADSWFDSTKLSYQTLLPFLVMYCKNSSNHHMLEHLGVLQKSINEARLMASRLITSIASSYEKLTGTVYIEQLFLLDKDNKEYSVLAVQQHSSTKCFAEMASRETVPDIIRSKTTDSAKIFHVESSPIDCKNCGLPNDPPMENSAVFKKEEFFDEEKHHEEPRMRFFTNLRTDSKQHSFANTDAFQKWLHEQVVRRTEGLNMLSRCLEEIKELANPCPP